MQLGVDSQDRCLVGFSSEVMILAESCPIEQFKQEAVVLLGKYLSFDAAQWVTRASVRGEDERSYLAAAHLHNLDESKLAAYQPFINRDLLLTRLMAEPNVAFDLRDVWPDKEYFSSDLYRDYAAGYSLERMLSILIARQGMNFCQAITVYRSDRERIFSAEELTFFETASQWLTRALRHTILESVGSSVVSGLGSNGVKPRAVVDKDGFIFELDAHLENWLHSQILNFDGVYFPGSLLQSSLQQGIVDYSHYRLEVVQQGDLYLVYFHCKLPFDSLTPKEWQVARSALECEGNKSIARKLDNSPGTVQKHLQNIYVKLGIAEMNDNHEKRRMLNMLLADYLRQQKTGPRQIA